jgi:hypothetical protein
VQAQELLRTLQGRGARLRVAQDGRLGIEPSSVLTDELRAEVRANRDALVEALRPQPAQASVSDLTDAPAIAVREQIGAVLLRSPRFGEAEVWVVLEPSMAPELLAEEAGRSEPRPVLLAEDVAKLRGKSDEMIRASLRVLAVFPSARLVQ